MLLLLARKRLLIISASCQWRNQANPLPQADGLQLTKSLQSVTANFIVKKCCYTNRLSCIKFLDRKLLFNFHVIMIIIQLRSLQILLAMFNSKKILPRWLAELIVLKIDSEFVTENSIHLRNWQWYMNWCHDSRPFAVKNSIHWWHRWHGVS